MLFSVSFFIYLTWYSLEDFFYVFISLGSYKRWSWVSCVLLCYFLIFCFILFFYIVILFEIIGVKCVLKIQYTRFGELIIIFIVIMGRVILIVCESNQLWARLFSRILFKDWHISIEHWWLNFRKFNILNMLINIISHFFHLTLIFRVLRFLKLLIFISIL